MADMKKFLLIDNNSGMLSEVLMSYGYDVKVASDGKQGLAYLDSGEKFDMVLLEVFLPELDGWETLKLIKSSNFYGDIPVIYLTSESNVHKMVFGLNLGADDYIVKPFNIQNLLARINAVLRRSKRSGMKALSPNVTNNQKTFKHSLTAREKDVLLLVTKGLDNSSIAKELFVSTITVKAHLQSIFRKLQVKSRTQAMIVAMENDLIDKEK